MRTEEQWNHRVLPKILKDLSPRQRRDIESHPVSKLPEIGDGMYICGPVNTGKSTMAIQMYIRARKDQYFSRTPGRIIFVSAYDFFDDLRRAQFVEDKWKNVDDPPPRDEYAAMAEYATATILFLDDLGSTRFTEWQVAKLQVLIDQRYEQLLPTVYTSNLDLDELSEALLGDQRTASRIRRTCKLRKVKA